MSISIGNCLRTGAFVLFEEYGFAVPADIFSVGDTYVLRTNPDVRFYNAPLPRAVTHVVTIGNVGFFKEAAGVAVVPASNLTIA